MGCEAFGAQQEENLEARDDPARRQREALAVKLGRAQQGGAPRRLAPALDHQVALAHGAQVAHQGERVLVFDIYRFTVGDRQGEAGALQKAGGVAQVREGRDARAEAAIDLALGSPQRLPQLPQRSAAQHGAQEQSIGLQDATDLDQGAGQVVHPMQAHGAQHEIELRRCERKLLLVGHHGQPPGFAGEAFAQIAADQLLDDFARAERGGDLVAVAAEIERHREGTTDIVQPFDQSLGDLALQEGMPVPVRDSALAPMAQHRAVENQHGVEGHHVRTRHRAYVRRKGGGG